MERSDALFGRLTRWSQGVLPAETAVPGEQFNRTLVAYRRQDSPVRPRPWRAWRALTRAGHDGTPLAQSDTLAFDGIDGAVDSH